MSHVRRTAPVLVIAALLVLSTFASGCTQTAAESAPPPEPVVSPPVIADAGVLRVGVDLDYPPFVGFDEDREAGIDIDVADALAAELGLDVETIGVEPTRTAEALATGEVDVVMCVPLTQAALIDVSLAGSYTSDGPAFFVSVEETGSAVTTLTVGAVGKSVIGAQEGSRAFWVLEEEFGEGRVTKFATLRAAMVALEAGEVDVVAGDALVGAYIARDFDTVRFAGQVEQATPVGVAVKKGATELEDAVRTSLDELAAGGVLETIRTKWVGDLPALETASPTGS